MQDMELIIFEIISNGGNAKALVYEAMEESEKGNFEEARKLLEEADTFLNKAHQVQTDLIQKEAYVPFHIHLFKNQGIWIGKSTPQAGDIVTFDWNGDGVADHIAIVEKVLSDRIVTLEGNTDVKGGDGSKVMRKTHEIDSSDIFGYARPQYQ